MQKPRIWLRLMVACAVLLISLLIIGQAVKAEPAEDGSKPSAQMGYLASGDKAVQALFKAFSAFVRPDFELLLADQFKPSKSAYITEVEKTYFAGPVLILDGWVQEAHPSAEKLVCKVLWMRRQMFYETSELKNIEGQAELIFQKTGDAWKLLQVSGEDPLTKR